MKQHQLKTSSHDTLHAGVQQGRLKVLPEKSAKVSETAGRALSLQDEQDKHGIYVIDRNFKTNSKPYDRTG